jgi:hypothetical protein
MMETVAVGRSGWRRAARLAARLVFARLRTPAVGGKQSKLLFWCNQWDLSYRHYRACANFTAVLFEMACIYSFDACAEQFDAEGGRAFSLHASLSNGIPQSISCSADNFNVAFRAFASKAVPWFVQRTFLEGGAFLRSKSYDAYHAALRIMTMRNCGCRSLLSPTGSQHADGDCAHQEVGFTRIQL